MQTSTVVTLLAGIAIFGSLLTGSKAVGQINVQLERFEQVGGEGIADSSKLRVRKYNRTVFILDGTLHILTDLDESYDVTVKVAYSSLGNNQFNEYPMKVPRKSVCKVMVDEYVDYQYVWINNTNLPYVPKGTREFCPFPKGEYCFRELLPDSSFMPPVVPAGLWRMTWEVLHPGDEVALQLQFFFRVTKEPMGKK